jgi:hypothetical protein
MAETYRVIQKHEEREYERDLAEQAMKVFCKKLGLRDIGLAFITPDAFGEHSFETPIAGFCPPGGKEIFVRRGLEDRALVLCVAHELRHCYQRQTGNYSLSKDFRESDARLFELECNPPATAPEIRRWLYLEKEFDETPGLRETFARVDELMRDRHAAESVRAAVGKRRISNSSQERIGYIHDLLSRLPKSQQFTTQRANLTRELGELLQTEGVAA